MNKGHQEDLKLNDVALADAFAYPGTVVIVSSNANVALQAVNSAWEFGELADEALLFVGRAWKEREVDTRVFENHAQVRSHHEDPAEKASNSEADMLLVDHRLDEEGGCNDSHLEAEA